MAPSAPLPLPPPAAPLTAFLEGDGTVHPSNGHDDSPPPPPPDIPPPTIPTPPKLPGKSNLKRHSMFGSPQSQQLNHHLAPLRHTQSLPAHVDNNLADPKGGMDKKDVVTAGRTKSCNPDGEDVVISDAEFMDYKRKDSRVTWTDNHGKDLAEVWEFEPSDTGDSDEESDSDSSQACTCVIQ